MDDRRGDDQPTEFSEAEQTGARASEPALDPPSELAADAGALDLPFEIARRTGVLFVHGIGTQPPAETFLDWSAPIVELLTDWRAARDGAPVCRAGQHGPDRRPRLAGRVQPGGGIAALPRDRRPRARGHPRDHVGRDRGMVGIRPAGAEPGSGHRLPSSADARRRLGHRAGISVAGAAPAGSRRRAERAGRGAARPCAGGSSRSWTTCSHGRSAPSPWAGSSAAWARSSWRATTCFGASRSRSSRISPLAGCSTASSSSGSATCPSCSTSPSSRPTCGLGSPAASSSCSRTNATPS